MRDVVFLHAFPLDASMWLPQVAALRGHVRMHAPNFPGFGGEPAGDARSLDQYADHVVAALDRAGVRRAIICGLSLGGYVAFALWRRHRARVAGLVLADTRAEADPPEAVEARKQVAENARRGGGEWMARNLPPLLSDAAPAGLWERVREVVRAQSGEAIARASLAMAARPDSRALLRGIAVPTLVIVGARDALTPPAAARLMAQSIPGARLVEIPKAGHLSSLEAPRDFCDALFPAVG